MCLRISLIYSQCDSLCSFSWLWGNKNNSLNLDFVILQSQGFLLAYNKKEGRNHSLGTVIPFLGACEGSRFKPGSQLRVRSCPGDWHPSPGNSGGYSACCPSCLLSQPFKRVRSSAWATTMYRSAGQLRRHLFLWDLPPFSLHPSLPVSLPFDFFFHSYLTVSGLEKTVEMIPFFFF